MRDEGRAFCAQILVVAHMPSPTGGFEVPTHLQRAPHRNFNSKNHTRLVNLLVSLRFRSSHASVPQGLANFGIWTLAPVMRAAAMPKPEHVRPSFGRPFRPPFARPEHDEV